MSYEAYKDKYKHISFLREDGILQMTLHTEGGPIVWTIETKVELTNALGDVSRDLANKAVIITGTGESFIELDDLPYKSGNVPPTKWDRVITDGRQIIMNHLDIEAPVIAALNGPAHIHAEIALMSDIVLATDNASIQDKLHFDIGMVPGDGVHVIFPLLLGLNRGRYFLWTAEKISAQQAQELGLISEILSRERLLPRAWELARHILKRPPLTVRYTRILLAESLRKAMTDHLRLGIAYEGLAAGDLDQQ